MGASGSSSLQMIFIAGSLLLCIYGVLILIRRATFFLWEVPPGIQKIISYLNIAMGVLMVLSGNKLMPGGLIIGIFQAIVGVGGFFKSKKVKKEYDDDKERAVIKKEINEVNSLYKIEEQKPIDKRNWTAFYNRILNSSRRSEVEKHFEKLLPINQSADMYKRSCSRIYDIDLKEAFSEIKQWATVPQFAGEIRRVTDKEGLLTDEAAKLKSILTGQNYEDFIRKIHNEEKDSILHFSRKFINDWDSVEGLINSGRSKDAFCKLALADYEKDCLDMMRKSLYYYATCEKREVETFKRILGIANVYLCITVAENDPDSPKCWHIDMMIARCIEYSRASIDYEDDVKDFVDYMLQGYANWKNSSIYELQTFLDVLAQQLHNYKLEEYILEAMHRASFDLTREMKDRLDFLKRGTIGRVEVEDTYLEEAAFTYDYRPSKWSEGEITEYFTKLFREKKPLSSNLIINDWTSSLKVENVKWDTKAAVQGIINRINDEFGDGVRCEIIKSKAFNDEFSAPEDTLLITTSGSNSSLNFPEIGILVSGEQLTKNNVTLHIFTMFLPDKGGNNTGEKLDRICRQVISVKEVHNPRLAALVTTIQELSVQELEKWFNNQNTVSSIY